MARNVRWESFAAVAVLLGVTQVLAEDPVKLNSRVNKYLKARKAEFDHHLVKPADMGVLRDLLTQTK